MGCKQLHFFAFLRYRLYMSLIRFMEQVLLKPKNPVGDKEAEFWAECRRRAMLHNVPAWKIAEQLYTHQLLDA
jgi:hypothetical protein